jgi:hypothetical protein
MEVLLHGFLNQRTFAVISLDDEAFLKMFHTEIALGRCWLVVGQDCCRHLDRAVAQRVLNAKATVAELLTMRRH